MPERIRFFGQSVCATAFLLIVHAACASADVFNMPSGQTSLQFLPVGNVSNASDPLTGHGRVDYNYNVSKCEITIGQYVQFLNSVATADTYGLYDPNMAGVASIAGIARNGSAGSYTYSAVGSPDRPIAFVSWGNAARFANWLTNGQPSGEQGTATTEAGSYALNGAVTSTALQAVKRDPSARYVIPTEDEWYKAAYYDPTKGGTNYWLYPMRTDGPIFSDTPPGTDAPNAAVTANFYQDDAAINGYDDGYALTGSTAWTGSTNYLSDVGAYSAAPSYYGTFDQGGNLMEWTERLNPEVPLGRGLRGGSWRNFEDSLRSTRRGTGQPVATGKETVGFRIVEVPEPATLTLMGLAAAVFRRRKSR